MHRTENEKPELAAEPSRYYYQTGEFGTLTLAANLSGPQGPGHVPEHIREVFRKGEQIKSVAVIYEGVAGSEKVDVWSAANPT